MMLSETDKGVLQRKFASMTDEVTLVVFADQALPASKDLIDFANTMAGLSPKIRVDIEEAQDGRNPRMRELHVDRWPLLLVTKRDFARIRYYGVPLGYELPAVLDAIVELSTSRTALSPRAKSSLATVRRKANIKVFVLATCPFCPTVARHAYRGAIESPNVTAEVIDSAAFPDLAARHAVMGVPKVVLNDNLDITGAMTDTEFFERLRDSDHALIDSMYG